MPLSKEQKDRIIKKYRVHDTDTGSAEVQIAILTEEIKQLTVHMKEHKHDYSSRLGLIKKVQERKKLMDYLKRENSESFVDLARELKLKIAQQRAIDKEELQKEKDKDNE
jgi:small subunit ribosomal protein S15